MRAKIQKSMLLVICITMLGTFGLVVLASHMQSVTSLQQSLQNEASYIQTALNRFGNDYSEMMDQANTSVRVTLIGEDGQVLYDSHEKEFTLLNHAEREEVKEAKQYGSGQAIRTSSTLGKQTFYYAVRLDNGDILRTSKNVDHISETVWAVVSYMVGIFLLMTGLAIFLANQQTKRLVAPIIALDLEHPLENTIYEELQPFLENMDEQNRAKEEVANMRKEFSANVSHELKTPLTSISGYAELMMSGLVKPEDMSGFAERIYNEASRLIGLIEDIIRLLRLDEKSVEFEKEEVDLLALASDICSRLSLQAEKKQVRIEVTGEYVGQRGVKRVLDEMIYNICENAIKYNVPNGSVNIWVGDTLQGPKIIVQDTGIGIPKEDQERIFERFYRVDKSHSKETGGTGLGLSIVKHGAILQDAQVQVESTIGQGTRMEIQFPKIEQ